VNENIRLRIRSGGRFLANQSFPVPDGQAARCTLICSLASLTEKIVPSNYKRQASLDRNKSPSPHACRLPQRKAQHTLQRTAQRARTAVRRPPGHQTRSPQVHALERQAVRRHKCCRTEWPRSRAYCPSYRLPPVASNKLIYGRKCRSPFIVAFAVSSAGCISVVLRCAFSILRQNRCATLAVSCLRISSAAAPTSFRRK
jgi:hypothetical protein